MPYLGNIPQANQRIKDSQAPIQNNFAEIQTLINVNHVDFDIADSGKHKWVTMPQQASDPGTLATEMALYTKSVSGTPQLFLENSNNGAVINLTSSINSTSGYYRLPSGILVKYGISGNQSNSGTFDMPTGGGIPVFTVIPWIVLFTPVSSNAPAATCYWIPGTTTTTKIGFTMTNTLLGVGTTASVAWVALGVG